MHNTGEMKRYQPPSVHAKRRCHECNEEALGRCPDCHRGFCQDHFPKQQHSPCAEKQMKIAQTQACYVCGTQVYPDQWSLSRTSHFVDQFTCKGCGRYVCDELHTQRKTDDVVITREGLRGHRYQYTNRYCDLCSPFYKIGGIKGLASAITLIGTIAAAVFFLSTPLIMMGEKGDEAGSVWPSPKANSMVLSSIIQNTLQRHQQVIDSALQATFAQAKKQAGSSLAPFYGQLQYHIGQVDAHFAPTKNNSGKLLRPTLLLMAYEASGAWGLTNDEQPHLDYLERALPAAVALELTHNFTLIHDDIEDNDAERRHRPTVWKLWGVPQAINTGDGMFSLARLTLWDVLTKGVEGDIAARLGALLDSACLILAEGQYLDISFEERHDISVAMYIDMISRKTAALMACAAEMGACLGTRNTEIIARLSSFGKAIGIAFQVRDDLLGIWATTAELGKTPAGDVYRRKKSLPVLHALEHANTYDQQKLHTIYRQEDPLTQQQVEDVLTIFERTQTKAYCQQFLTQQCQLAYDALASVPQQGSQIAARALHDMETLVQFVEGAAH